MDWCERREICDRDGFQVSIDGPARMFDKGREGFIRIDELGLRPTTSHKD